MNDEGFWSCTDLTTRPPTSRPTIVLSKRLQPKGLSDAGSWTFGALPPPCYDDPGDSISPCVVLLRSSHASAAYCGLMLDLSNVKPRPDAPKSEAECTLYPSE